MSEPEKQKEGSTTKINLKKVVGLVKPLIKILIVILLIIIIGVSGIYTINKDTFEDAAKESKNYTNNSSFDPEKGIIITVENEDGTVSEVDIEEIFNKIDGIENYLKDDDNSTKEEKLKYLMEAELVTKYPYISSLEGDDTKLNGIVKFYRFSSDSDAGTQMIYVKEEDFDAKLNEAKSSRDEEIFKYFTINEDKEIVIATWSETTKKITTNDPAITAASLNEEQSSFTYADAGDGSYTASKYTMTKKELIAFDTLVKNYAMPFNLLWAFLVQTGDYYFTEEIATLAYESDIRVGIYDNKNTSTRNETEEYNKSIRFTENTELNFAQAGIDVTSPQYSQVIKYCKGIIAEERKIHYSNINSGVDITTYPENLPIPVGDYIREDGALHYGYITGMTADGTITTIVEATDTNAQTNKFTTTENTKTVSAANPSIGVFYVDNWMAKWEAAYQLKAGETKNNDSSGGELYNNEYKSLLSEKLTGNTFVENILNQHSNQILQSATDGIRANTNLAVTSDLVKNSIWSHIYGCTSCKTQIANAYSGKTIAQLEIEGEKEGVIYAILSNASGYTEGDAVGAARYLIYNCVYNTLQANKNANFETQLNSIGVSQWATAEIANINVNVVDSSNTQEPQSYEQNEMIISNEGEKFKEIVNKDEYFDAKQAILKRSEWFWEYIRAAEDTAKLEDMIRIIFNIAFDTDQFGEYSEEDIANIFKAFEPGDAMISANYQSVNLLRDYIRMWENSAVLSYINGTSGYTDYVAKYISEDKTVYYIRDDGKGHPTVGFGIDIFNGGFEDEFLAQGYTEEQLKDTSGSVSVPVQFVDALEESTINNMMSEVKTRVASLNLENYQIYALVSRAYNCGVDGAISGYTEIDFIEAYNQYYNPETDNKYGKTEGDFNHNLYTKFMSSPTKSGGEVLEGLVKRRKSEWTLFQTGYMDTLDKWCGQGDYPEGIRTFQAAGYVFPEYPQTSTVGDTSLYAGERYGDPAYNRTLGSSGCGAFTLAMILSGMLGDSSIDPISVRDNLEEYFGYSYYVVDVGSSNCIYDDDFLYTYYGVHSTAASDYDTVIQALKEGKCAVGHEPGHFVAIIPVPDEFQGQGYEFFVLDSARGTTGAYKSISDFKSRSGQTELTFRAIISF